MGKIKPKSLLLQSNEGSNFSKQINPLFQITKSESGTFLIGKISSDREDADHDVFDVSVLKRWEAQLKSGEINLNLNHDKDVRQIIGQYSNGELIKSSDGYNDLYGAAKLNIERSDVVDLINTVDAGISLGLSIEANPEQENWFRKEGSIRIITSARLMGVGIVKSPACFSCKTDKIVQKSTRSLLL
jgi:phage head maturation protease